MVGKRIAIDIDDTISRTDDRFHEILNEQVVKHGYDNYLLNMFDYNEVRTEAFRTAKPFDDAVGFFEYLNDKGYKITILTARDKKYADITKEWVDKNGFKYEKIAHDGKKENYLQQNNIRYLIDDRVEYAYYSPLQVTSFIKTTGQSTDKIIRFQQFEELKQYL